MTQQAGVGAQVTNTSGSGYENTGKLARACERIAGWVENGEINGAALAVAVGSEQVAERYFGEASGGRPAGEETLWPLASISKLYTAAMIMALVERGELGLAMPVHTVLPEFTGGGKEQVTLRHLLTHTSGMIYESPVMEQRLQDQTPYEELIDEAYLYPLMFEPGTRLSYSDYGLAIAGRVAERVTGVDFNDLVTELVAKPAGLEHTYMRPPQDVRDRLAHVVGPLAYGTEGSMYNSDYALQLAHPAFGTVTSAGDLLRFGMLFATESPSRIHSRATVRTMTTDQTGGNVPGGIPGFTTLNRPTPWGIAFMLANPGSAAPELLSAGSYGHGGASGCTLWIDPLENVSIAYVSNKHAGTGRLPFTRRWHAVVNGVLAGLTA